MYRRILGQLNWVGEIWRRHMSFSVFESSTKFPHVTVADIIYVNMITRKFKRSRCFIPFSKVNLNTIKIHLFTDASFNNLPNGGIQAEHVTFLTDSKNHTCPLYWNSPKLKRVVHTTVANITC